MNARILNRWTLMATIVGLCTSAVYGQTTSRVSLDSLGNEGNGSSSTTAISDDGMITAFGSSASNLVAGDTNGVSDIFVHDRSTGLTTRVSVDSAGTEANGKSIDVAISGDGRFVGFQSLATNLVSGDTNGTFDVFVHDRVTGTMTLVSATLAGAVGNDHSFDPRLSHDGRFIAFTSRATNFVAGDTNVVEDVYVRDMQTGVTERVSLDSSGNEPDNDCTNNDISADGRWVVFSTEATNLVSGDLNAATDVFLHDRTSGITTRVSVASDGTEGDSSSSAARISGDGSLIVFVSAATNLVAGDTNATADIFLHDQGDGSMRRVGVGFCGEEADGDSPDISTDGTVVVYNSESQEFDPQEIAQIIGHRLATGETLILSLNSSGDLGDIDGDFPAVNGDGSVVAFHSDATNMVPNDTNASTDIFVRADIEFTAWTDLGNRLSGTTNPCLKVNGDLTLGSQVTFSLTDGLPGTPSLVVVGFQRIDLALQGGTLVPSLDLLRWIPVDAQGQWNLSWTVTPGLPPGSELFLQILTPDSGAPVGLAFSNAVTTTSF